jgi:hypothetical protein
MFEFHYYFDAHLNLSCEKRSPKVTTIDLIVKPLRKTVKRNTFFTNGTLHLG